MMELPLILYDCKYFDGDKPCQPNKQYGVFCSNCSYYEKDETIAGEFPPIGEPDAQLDKSGYKKIIIIKLDAVGDVLRTTSILRSLKEKYPDSEVTWITKSKSFSVIKDNILIDEIYFSEDELEHLYNNMFDVAINLDSGKESCIIMSNLSAHERFGYTIAGGKPYPINNLANEWYLMGVDDNTKKLNKKTYHQIIHEICGLGYNNTKPTLSITGLHRKNTGLIKNKFALHNYDEFILVNLGGGNRWQYKKWDKAGFIELVNLLSASSEKTAVGIIAGNEDRDFYNEISDAVEDRNNVIYFGCDNSIDDLICISSLADKILTADSLALHIATALDKYVVVVVGPTSHTELDVFGKGKIVFSDKVDCLCCYLNRCSKTVTCMNTLSAEEIVQFLI
jgi:ADP-heptose:LPS heptosyltransferase